MLGEGCSKILCCDFVRKYLLCERVSEYLLCERVSEYMPWECISEELPCVLNAIAMILLPGFVKQDLLCECVSKDS